ncbi:SpoIID/LytB domain-containing protein [Priestia megaterium]|uniref:SpoIID/LytB domain-containing protein n=1 Tax=Priestia megaterium TaxID=1404 RepID=UPI0030093269
MLRKLFAILCLISFIGTYIPIPTQANNETKSVQRQRVAFTPEVAKKAITFYLKAWRLEQHKRFRVQNVKSFKVEEVKELPLDFAKKYIDVNYYESKGIPFKFIYAQISINVKQENKYFLNGKNYRMTTLIQKEGKWEVDHKSEGEYRYASFYMAPVHEVVENNLGFGTDDEKEMAEIMRKHYQGIYVNRKGERVGDRNSDNIATEEQLMQEMTGVTGTTSPTSYETISANVNPYYKRPQYIRVVMRTDKNKKYYGCAGVSECIKRVDFLEYSKHVLPNEWEWDSPDEALKTGAMAVKMYAWYSVAVNPKAGTGDADVFDTARDHVYMADLSHITKQPGGKEWVQKAQSIFHAPGVAGVGFKESTRNNLIPIAYLPGPQAEKSGTISQKGSVKLAKEPHKMNFIDIIKYYVEESPQANNARLDFYRYAK